MICYYEGNYKSVTTKSCHNFTRIFNQIPRLVLYGEDWSKIKAELLPSKEEELLQFRYRSSAAQADSSKLKKFSFLDKEKRTRDVKWSHQEDLNLLRGLIIFF